MTNILLEMILWGKFRYYSDRIDWLTERRNQIAARIYADRLALKGLDKEINRCKEAMQKTEDYE